LTKSALDELAQILDERKFKRKTFLAVLLDSLDPISKKSREWFDYEAKAVSEQIEVLGAIMPEETPTWKAQLEDIKKRFEGALQYIEEVTRKAKKGELRSVGDIYRRPPSKQPYEFPELIMPSKREKTPLDAAQSVLAIWDAASDLESLVSRVELEAIRTLRLRQIMRKEVTTS
jgi:hypothetical protein